MKHSEVALSAARAETLEDLRKHLQWAIDLDHASLPPYLCALYSIDPERNPDAVQVVSSVFVEEMIHLALAANLLNAVGGKPRLATSHMLPRHRRRLPHGDRTMELSLRPLGAKALEMFLRLEQPAPRGAFNGSLETLGAAVGTVYAVKAQALMQMSDGDGTVAGPTFEYVRPDLR